MNQEFNSKGLPEEDFTGRALHFYHPNQKGTGSALRVEPRINQSAGDRYNCFFLELAAQKSVAKRESGGATFARFDWERKITVKLGFLDVSELLMVMEGHAPQVGGSRSGLYHATPGGNTLIAFKHDQERGHYYLSLSRKRNEDKEAQRIGIALSPTEITGLRCILQTALFFVIFPGALRHRKARTVKNEAQAQQAA